MAVKCKRDCEYYSTFTETCDYSLIMYHSRGCPTNACTKYIKRTKRRPWSSTEHYSDEGLCVHTGSEKMVYVPEPPVEPPGEWQFITADCGHDVFEDEEIYEGEDGKTICPECMEEKFNVMSLSERAYLINCDSHTVHFSKNKIS